MSLQDLETSINGEAAPDYITGLTNAFSSNPDDEAKKLKLQKATGVPALLMDQGVRKNAELQQFLTSPEIQSLSDTSPATAAWLSQQDNANVAHDDLGNAVQFEAQFKTARTGWQDTKDGFNELATAFKRALPSFRRSISGTSMFIDKLTKPYNTTDGSSDESSIYAQSGAEYQARQDAARAKMEPAKAELQRPDMQYTDRSSMGRSPLLFAATRFIENAPTQIPMIGGGLVSALGAPHIGIPLVVAGTTLAFGAEGSDAYDEVYKKTGNEELALLAGIGNGTVEIADGFADMLGGRLFAGKSLFKKALKKDLADRLVSNYTKTAAKSAVAQGAKQTAKGAVFEGLTEGVQGVAQQFIPNVATGESSTFAEYATTFAENALPGAFGGTVLGGPVAMHKAYSDKADAQFIVKSLTDPNATNEDKVKAMAMAYSDMREMATKGDVIPPPAAAARSIIAGMVAGDSAFAKEADNALQAHSNATALDTMAELAKASKIIPRDEETAVTFFQSLRNEGVSDVAIPVQRFVDRMTAQGLDPMVEADRITGKADSLNDALATSGDFHIPVEMLITKVLPTDAYAGLRDDIRLHPNDWTAREAKEWESTEAAQSFTTALESMQKADPVQAVYQSMMGELIKAQIPQSQAEIQAQLWADRYRTRAARLKVDPFELYQQDKEVRVARQGMEQMQGGELFQSHTITTENGVNQIDLQSSSKIDRGTKIATILPKLDVPNLFDTKTITAEEAVKRGVEYYNNEMKGQSVESPAFSGEQVSFTDVGILHLTGQHEREISPGNMARRLKLLPKVREVLATTPFVSETRKEDDGNRYGLMGVFSDGTVLMVAVHQTEKDGKIFLSAYDWEDVGKKIKQPPSPKLLPSAQVVGVGEAPPSANGSILNQSEINVKRGFFRPSLREIGLLKDADLSTFLHETGHAWLEELRQDAQTDGVDPIIVEDWSTIKTWLGISADTNEITVEQHEQFARGFEMYLAEGKSPSPALNDAFRRFSAWLKQVYTDLTKLNVKLTPEVRAVMDRLIASEEEIKAAKTQQGIVELFATAEDAGMTPEEFVLYRKAAEKEHQAAVSQLETKLMNELRRDKKAWWREAKTRVMSIVEEEAKQNPVYKVINLLLTGKEFDGTEYENTIKLNKAELVAMYGEGVLKKMPRGFGTVLYADEGAPVDVVAAQFGFTSGDEMIKGILDAPKMKVFIRDETDRRLKAEYGDTLTDGKLAEEAMNAVHNEHRGAILLKELTAIRRKQKDSEPAADLEKQTAAKEQAYQARWAEAERKMAVEIEKGTNSAVIEDLKAEMAKMKVDHAVEMKQAKKELEYNLKWKDAENDLNNRMAAGAITAPPVAAYRDAAKTIISGKPLESLSPVFFSRAEKRQGDEAVKAFKKGDYGAAQRAKEQQVLNHFLYIESTKALAEAEKIRKYATNMMKRDSLSKLGKADQEILAQVQVILEGHGFDRVTKLELNERVESLERFIQRISEEEQIDLPIDPDMFAGELPNYRRMTIEELRAMYDAVKVLEKLAQMINSIRIKGQRVDFESLVRQAVDSINSLHSDSNPTEFTDYDKAWYKELADKGISLAFGTMRPQAIIESLDGDRADQQGIFHDALWEPYNDASAKENELKANIVPQINELLEGGKISASRYREKYRIEAMGEDMSIGTMIGVVLNMGNESNLDKLMRGGIMRGQDQVELSAQALDEIINHLTKQEMDMVQGLWNLVKTLKPEMIALELRMFGIQPEWVKPKELVTKHGVYPGGYWPVVFDSNYSKQGRQQENAATVNEALSVMPFSQAFTKKGHLKSRTKAAFPMHFDWQRIASRHIDQVITDIAYREFIITSAKVLRSQDIRTAIIDRLHGGYTSELDAWLKSIVDQQQVLSKADGTMTKIRNAARTNATVAFLGLKVANALVDTVVTPMQAWSRVEALSLATGIRDTLTKHSATKETVRAMSPYMRHLWANMDRELSDGMKRLAGKSGTRDQIKRVSMEARAWAYEIGAMMVWRGAFIDAQNKHDLSGKAAVEFADDVVRGTSDAGRKGDLNAWERNDKLKEFTMFIGPLSVAVNQIAKAVRVGRREGFSNPIVWKTLIGLWVSNALFYDMLLGKGPGADDEPDKWIKWAMAKFILFPFQSLPFIREGANLLESKVTGDPSTSRSVPLVETGKAVWNGASAVAKYVESGDDLDKAIKNANMALGLSFGLPSSQINITGQYIADQLSGEYDPAHVWSPVTDIFFKRKRSQN